MNSNNYIQRLHESKQAAESELNTVVGQLSAALRDYDEARLLSLTSPTPDHAEDEAIARENVKDLTEHESKLTGNIRLLTDALDNAKKDSQQTAANQKALELEYAKGVADERFAGVRDTLREAVAEMIHITRLRGGHADKDGVMRAHCNDAELLSYFTIMQNRYAMPDEPIKRGPGRPRINTEVQA